MVLTKVGGVPESALAAMAPPKGTLTAITATRAPTVSRTRRIRLPPSQTGNACRIDNDRANASIAQGRGAVQKAHGRSGPRFDEYAYTWIRSLKVSATYRVLVLSTA